MSVPAAAAISAMLSEEVVVARSASGQAAATLARSSPFASTSSTIATTTSQSARSPGSVVTRSREGSAPSIFAQAATIFSSARHADASLRASRIVPRSWSRPRRVRWRLPRSLRSPDFGTPGSSRGSQAWGRLAVARSSAPRACAGATNLRPWPAATASLVSWPACTLRPAAKPGSCASAPSTPCSASRVR